MPPEKDYSIFLQVKYYLSMKKLDVCKKETKERYFVSFSDFNLDNCYSIKNQRVFWGRQQMKTLNFA